MRDSSQQCPPGPGTPSLAVGALPARSRLRRPSRDAPESLVRIGPAHESEPLARGQLRRGFLPGWPLAVSGAVPHAYHYVPAGSFLLGRVGGHSPAVADHGTEPVWETMRTSTLPSAGRSSGASTVRDEYGGCRDSVVIGRNLSRAERTARGVSRGSYRAARRGRDQLCHRCTKYPRPSPPYSWHPRRSRFRLRTTYG
jgi:hypothetical protein